MKNGSRITGFAIGMVLLFGAGEAGAGSVEIIYSVDPGSVIGGSPVPGLSGAYTIRYTATGPNAISSGPSTLVSLSLNTSFSTYGIAGVPGTFPHSGFSLTSGGGITTVTSAGYLRSGDKQTLGFIYFPGYGTIPTGTGRDEVVIWESNNGYGFLNFTFDAFFSGFPTFGKRARFVGQEVSRTYVPEPGALGALGAGSLLLSVFAARRRARLTTHSRH